jgi:hypothetical protein
MEAKINQLLSVPFRHLLSPMVQRTGPTIGTLKVRLDETEEASVEYPLPLFKLITYLGLFCFNSFIVWDIGKSH